MEIADYIFFSLIGFTVLFTIGVSCCGIYCWWKAKKSEPRSCYVAIADETSPLLSKCADPCIFGCSVCKNVNSSTDSSPPVFSPANRTPGSKYSNKVLVTSGGFPITTPLSRTRSSSRSKFGSANSTKRKSKKSLQKFTLIRDYAPETNDNEAHATRGYRPASELKSTPETVSATGSSSNDTSSSSNVAETIHKGIHSNNDSQTIHAEVHSSNDSDYSCSTMRPLVVDLDLIGFQEQSSTPSYTSRTTDSNSSKYTSPGTLEVSECTTTDVFTPGRYSTPSYPNHAIRALSSSSDYARSSSADNSWESSSGSITCALGNSSSDENVVNLPPIRKGGIHYVVKDGKGFFTSDTSAFSSVPL